MIQRQVALFVTEIIDFAFFVFEHVGKVLELEAVVEQGLFFYLGLSGRVQLLQNAAVFTQRTVYIAHVGSFVFVEAVVVSVPALVGTKFLVDTAVQFGAAFQAIAFHNG